MQPKLRASSAKNIEKEQSVFLMIAYTLNIISQ